jgi:hypothetical protein
MIKFVTGKIETLLRNSLRPIYARLLIFFKQGVLKKNLALKNAYLGKRCFLIANGSSLKYIDLKSLNNEHVIGCNLLFRNHKDFHKIPWFAYVIVESKSSPLLPKGDPMRDDVLYPELASAAKDQETLFFFSLNNHSFHTKFGIFKGRKAHYLKSLRKIMDYKELSLDMTGDFTFLDGVGYAMIGAALYMGFKEIYLCGFDYTFSPMQYGHFYEDWVRRTDEPVDPRHLRMREIAHKNNAEIYNLTPSDLESPIYKKYPIEKLNELVGDFKSSR